MKTVETLIIGAGVTGLTYAANTNEDYIIFEKESAPGGLCKTFYQDGFVWDYAGHFFHFATPELKEKFEKEISADNMVQCIKNTNINYMGNIIDYPFQMNIHELPKDEFIDCLYDLFHRNEKEDYDNFEEMLYGKFGKSITEKFLKPYNEKLYACNLNELDKEAMGRFFPYANPKQIIDNMKNAGGGSETTYNSSFDYPKSGAQYFINILLKSIDNDRLKLNSEVKKIDIDKKIAVVNGEEYHYKKLINTTPLNHFVSLIPKKYGECVDGVLSCNKVLVFNLGFDKKAKDTKTHWTYVPMKNINFYRVGYYDNILGTDKLSMYIEIGFKENEEINVEEQLDLTISNLKNLGIITDHKLIAHNSILINPGYVHITENSVKQVDKLQKMLNKENIYTVGRYGRWTYCSIEDCMIDALNLVIAGCKGHTRAPSQG